MDPSEVRERLHYSVHALEVCRRRGVSRETVTKMIADPEVTQQAKDGRTRYWRGNLCAVVAQDEGSDNLILVTVLLRQEDEWTDEDVAERPED